MRLCCQRCGAGLVPAFTGLRCPRATACGRGGIAETAWSLVPTFYATTTDLGVSA